MKIALDFDNTLFQTVARVIEVYNSRNSTNIEFSQVAEYNLYECFPIKVADKLITLFADREVYDMLRPYKGATTAIKTLSTGGHELFVATSTDTRNLVWKEQLLQRYFPCIPKENLIRIHNKSLLNVDVLVDDHLDMLTKTLVADRVCFNQPWNNSPSKDFVYDIYRFSDWDEINDIISKIERKNKEWEK